MTSRGPRVVTFAGFAGVIASALTVAVVVWLVYFVIEVTRALNVWPA